MAPHQNRFPAHGDLPNCEKGKTTISGAVLASCRKWRFRIEGVLLFARGRPTGAAGDPLKSALQVLRVLKGVLD